MDTSGTGRVRLSDFYKPALGGHWQFQESVHYLKQLGALDETDAEPRVIIANYISSPSNCIASSSYYSVCCIDECEGLLGHLERQIAAPEATTTRIAELVTQLSSSSVAAPQKLSPGLLGRLGEIAAGHGGTVPLHGRLFAQWMHHVYPRECPYPHLSGTTNPQTPDEWLESTGQETTATDEEMLVHVNKAELGSTLKKNSIEQEEAEVEVLPWSPEEELLVVRPSQIQQASGSSTLGSLRSALLFSTVVAIAYGLVHNSWTVSSKGASPAAEKLFV